MSEMSWMLSGTTYTFYNFEGKAIVKTSNFEDAMMLIRTFNMKEASNSD